MLEIPTFLYATNLVNKSEVQVIIYLVRELDFFLVHFTQNLKHRTTLWQLIHQTEILI